MAVTSRLNYLRIAPRKVRLVADLIRKKKVEEDQNILNFTVKKAARPLLKLLNSAVANARNNLQLDPNNLYISKITVDEGPKYKRWMPRARGQATEIQKKTSNVTLILEETLETEKIKPKKIKKAKKAVVSKKEKEKKTPEQKQKEVLGAKKPKLRPKPEIEKPKPKITRGIRRIFRRKAF